VIAFRIATQRHAVFDGAGAAEYGGRWNSPGRPVIYASRSLSLAMLEQLAHAGTGRLPHDQAYIEITIPDDLSVEIVTPTDVPRWDAPERLASRAFGDCWLTEQRSCVLLVPSVIVSVEQNVVINPAHSLFGRITASTPRALQWDTRLKRFFVRRP
jgi:RES domain-containing protein